MQIHDFNPGFGPEVSPVGSNGFGTRTFWTVAIPDSDVSVNFAAGKAEMRVDNLSIPDYGTKRNALGPNWQTAFDPAMVSFDVVWSGPITRRVSVLNGTQGNQYAGNYVENQVTVTWSGTNLATGFTFTANPGTLATSSFDGGFAELGHERNGTFFDPLASATSSTGFAATPSGANTPIAGTSNSAASTTQSLWNALNYPLATTNSQSGIYESLPALTATPTRPVSEPVFELPSDPAATWTNLF